MPCSLCASDSHAEFPAEVVIHFQGLENLGKPGVLLFPKVLVCMGCGRSHFTVPNTKLMLLGKRPATTESSGVAVSS
jgi:hypothetical protein